MPLIGGEVKPENICLDYTDLRSPDIFYRQLKFKQFDVSEMSFSSFLKARAEGWPYRLLPVFHNRSFFYTAIFIRLASGIRREHPEDLKGKRVGVAEYQQTAALWIRGILQHEFGVCPEDMEWFQERPPHLSHAGASGFTPPPGLKFQFSTTDFSTMFLNNDLDAAITYYPASNSSMDRPKADLSKNPRFSGLFRDPKKEAVRYFKKAGFAPPHHITVVRESVLEEHPWVALSLMEAFQRAKDIAVDRLYKHPPSALLFSSQEVAMQRQSISDDPYVYGIKANAKAIDTVQTFSVEQGITQRKQPWDELFPEELIIAEERLPGEIPLSKPH